MNNLDITIQVLEQKKKEPYLSKKQKKAINQTIRLLKGTSKKKPEKNRIREFQLYVLYCEGGNRYVGITAYKDVNKRLKEHKNGKGAKWTSLHKPLYIEESYTLGVMSESQAVKLETIKTLELMQEYGTANVRGGKFCQVEERVMLSTNIGLLNDYGLRVYYNKIY